MDSIDEILTAAARLEPAELAALKQSIGRLERQARFVQRDVRRVRTRTRRVIEFHDVSFWQDEGQPQRAASTNHLTSMFWDKEVRMK